MRETVGGYDLCERIGEGGTAEVYRARARDGRAVAVKLVAPRARTQPTVAARFRRESAVLARLDHPNLLALLEFGEDEARGPYLVVPLIEGATLAEVLRGRRASPEAVLLVLGELLDGLAALHAAGLVHRDLKPENVMLTPAGRVVLLDMGLAWHDEHTRCTEEGVVAGSVPYMSPEQVEGRAITPASDVWSVGVIAYELIAGRRPFERRRQSEEVAAILAGSCPRLEECDRRVAPALAELVHACLRASPAERPRDAAALLAQVRALIDWVDPRDEATVHGELARLVRDPDCHAREVAGRRGEALRREASAARTAGDAFGAIALLDRAMAYDPDNALTRAAVDAAASGVEAGGTPTASTDDMPAVRSVAPDPPPAMPRPGPRRRAAVTAAGAVAALALLVGVGARVSARRAVTDAPPRAASSARPVTRAPEGPAFAAAPAAAVEAPAVVPAASDPPAAVRAPDPPRVVAATTTGARAPAAAAVRRAARTAQARAGEAPRADASAQSPPSAVASSPLIDRLE